MKSSGKREHKELQEKGVLLRGAISWVPSQRQVGDDRTPFRGRVIYTHIERVKHINYNISTLQTVFIILTYY